MPPAELEHLLTPAAREMLASLVDDLRGQLLREAAASAVRETGSIREISVSDLARSYGRLLTARPQLIKSVVDRGLAVYAILGALMAVLGLVLVLLHWLLPTSQAPSFKTSLIMSYVGGSIYFAASILRRARSRRRKIVELGEDSRKVPSTMAEGPLGRFLLSWTELEVGLRSLATTTFGESASRMPLSTLLTELRDSHRITDSAHRGFTSLLQLRNRVVHSPSSVSKADLFEGIHQAEALATELPNATPWSSAL